jgi:hypothetical protein
MNQTIQDEAVDYLAAVRAALDDLPEAERAELLEDLESHLHEVAAEGGSLTDRLGEPGAYAEELRASAGLPPRVQRSARRPLPDRLRDPALRRAALEFGNQLRPAWWLLRAYAAVRLLGVATGTPLDETLSPEVYRSTVLGTIVLVLLAVGSVLLGRQRLRGPARWAIWLLNAVLAWCLLMVLWNAADRIERIAHPSPGVDDPPVAEAQWPPSGVITADGRPITNIYVYDSKGRPIQGGVLLYDQDGAPIVTSPDINWLPVDKDGTPIPNLYPQRQVVPSLVVGQLGPTIVYQTGATVIPLPPR